MPRNYNAPRIQWKPEEWSEFFGRMKAIEEGPNPPKLRFDWVVAANKRMPRARPVNSSGEASALFKKYDEYRKGATKIRGKTLANASTTQSAKPSAENPYPHVPLPPPLNVNANDKRGPMLLIQDVEIDGLPPPTFKEEITEMAIEVGAELVAGILGHDTVRAALRGLIEVALGREQAAQTDKTRAGWAGTELHRGPRVVVVGLLNEQIEITRKRYGERANLAFWQSSQSKQQLKGMLGEVDAVIGVTKFMSHSADQICMSKAREKYIRHGGGMTGLMDKLETICVNWTRRELQAHPRAGSMSAEKAEAAH